MSWTDDIRCLYCDGRLPLYRKITSGQFCNAAHSRAYWQKQERLAIERLEQTHHSLRVNRSLYVQPSPQPEAVPELGEIARLPLAQIGSSPEMIAADPLAYEMSGEGWATPTTHRLPRKPRMSLAQRIAMLCARPWQLANRMANCQYIPAPRRRPLYPSSAPVTLMCRVGAAEWIEASLIDKVAPAIPTQTVAAEVEPVACASLPINSLSLATPPQSEELQRLLDEQIPQPDQLLALPRCAVQGKNVNDAPVGYILQPLSIARAPWIQLRLNHDVKTELPAASLIPLALDYPLQRGGPPGPRPTSRSAPQGVDALRGPEVRPTSKTSVHFALHLAPAVRDSLGTPQSIPSIAQIEPGGIVLDTPYVALPMRKLMVARAAAGSRNFESVPSPARLLPLACTNTPAVVPIHIVLRRSALAFAASGGTEPARPASKLQPLDRKPVTDLIPPPHLWVQALDAVRNAPPTIKKLTLAIPVILGVALHPPSPKLPQAVTREWGIVRQTVLDRAAVVLNEDFRAGLNRWVSRGEGAAAWSFDSNGFVRPGPLAIYRPSRGLTDYQMQFMGLIDKKALSWVVRAADFDNYYVVKLVVLKPGPLTTLGVTRYAVVDGRTSSRIERVAPIDARPDMLYRVRLDVHGDNYVLAVQGRIVDTWSESRLKRGGVGFFSARGEESRMRWLEVTHQYDTLGRLCAYLAPYDISNTKGSFER